MPKITKTGVWVAVSVALMTVGSISDMAWFRGWAILVGLYAGVVTLKVAVRRAAEHVKAWVKSWVFETHENALRKGMEMGRELEATERFIASTREDEQPWRTSGS